MDKKQIIFIAVVILIVIVMGFAIYKIGSKIGNPDSVEIPKNKTGDLSKAKVDELKALAKNLYNDMEGWNISFNENLYSTASNLDSRELLALNNIYNIYYQQETGESFLEWLQSQNFSYDSLALGGVTDNLIDRLIELNVS